MSIDPDPKGGHYGIAALSSARYSGPAPDLSQPVVRGELRDVVEADILIDLAGDLAADLIAPQTGYVTATADEEWAERAAAVLAAQSPRHRELVERAKRGELIFADEAPASFDELHAAEASHALVGQESLQHLAWLRAVARRLVGEHRSRIERLAEALLAEPSRVISGKRATKIIAGGA